MKKKAFLCVISCPTFPSVYLWWLLKQKPRSISPSPKANKNPKLKSQNILRRLRHEPRGCHGNSQKGYESALTKCVNSLPPKRSSVFSMFLLCDIRSFEDCGEVVVGGGKGCVWYFLFYFFFFFANRLQCLTNCICNPVQSWTFETERAVKRSWVGNTVEVVFLR